MSKDEYDNPLIVVSSNGTAPLLAGLSGTSGFSMMPQSSYDHIHSMRPAKLEDLEAEVKRLTARLDEFEKQWGWMLKESEDGNKDEGV